MTEQELLNAALNIGDPVELRALLDRECANNPALRAQVEHLLAMHLAGKPRDMTVDFPSAGDSSYSAHVDDTHLGKNLPPGAPPIPAQNKLHEHAAESSHLPPTRHAKTPAPPPPSPEPTSFGRYQIRRPLGSGSFGSVYVAFDPQLHRNVAIKVPKLDRGDPRIRDKFLQEARRLAQLNHPGIVAVYDIGAEEERCYIVSEYLEGQTLNDWLRGRQVEWQQAIHIAGKIADALAHAHEQRIIHRDLKPSNIMMVPGGTPVLVDFGLAISDATLTQHELGLITGTAAYMAPEQARGAGHRIDGRTDIYALGVILYRMLTGRLPFTAKDKEELLRQVREDEPQPPRQLNAAIPRSLEHVCLKSIAKELRHRYTTATDLAYDLRAVLAAGQAPTPGAAPPARAASSVLTATYLVQPPENSLPGPPKEAAPAAGLKDDSWAQRREREAERRRVTIVRCGCDVFTSPAILQTLDPEEQQEVLAEFRQLCRKLVRDFGGSVGQLTDTGVQLCFGFPMAYEDAAQRAVRCGRAVLEHGENLRGRLRSQHGVELALVAAIHSDLAVVQETKVGAETNLSVVGAVITVVGQLEELAEPNSVICSAETHERIKGYFDCASLGPKKFKGIGLQEVFGVTAERAGGSRVDIAEPGSLTPLIGRDLEVGLLRTRWEQAVEGMGQVVLLIGDAGLGKSRLVHTLKTHVCGGNVPGTVVEWRCTPQFQNSSLFPPTEYFERSLALDRHDAPSTRLDKLVKHLADLDLAGDEEVALLASLLSIPHTDRYPPLNINPQMQKERTFALLWDWLRAQAAQNPVLFVLEDLHWLDPTTLAFIEDVVSRGLSDRILTLLTFRPEFVTPWKSMAHQTQIALNRLTRGQIGEMMAVKAGVSAISKRLIDQIAARTDGVPLFIEEFTRTVIESGALQEREGSGSDSFRSHEIPTTLQDLLTARLDRIGINLEVAQLGAAMGREFSYELMHAVSPLPEAELQGELKKLVGAGLLSEQGRPPRTRYTFKHALMQDAAYNTLIKKRRQQFHQALGDVLERQFPQTAVAQPEVLALHFTEAGCTEKAIDYWEKAGVRSLERRAHKEAIQQFQRALELLRGLPESPERFRREIKIHTELGVPLQATIGYSAPEVEQNYKRGHQLCERLGLTTELFPVVYGMFRFYMLQAKYQKALELAAQLIGLSESAKSTAYSVAANRAMGGPLVYIGKHREALPYLEKVTDVAPTPEMRAELYRMDVVDPWIAARSYLSWAHWLLGRPDLAQEHSDEAVRIAEGLDHSFSLTLALCFSQWIHQFNRDVQRTRATADKALALAEEHGFAFWFGWCRVMRGWAMSQEGEHESGIKEIEEGIVAWRAQGSELGSHHFLGLLAESCLNARRLDRAAQALDEGKRFTATTGEAYWAAERRRLRGKLLLRLDPSANASAAERKFREALAIATRQHALPLQLRAAFSLAKLLAGQGRASEARAALSPICDMFAPGVRSADLEAARQLMMSLPI